MTRAAEPALSAPTARPSRRRASPAGRWWEVATGGGYRILAGINFSKVVESWEQNCITDGHGRGDFKGFVEWLAGAWCRLRRRRR